VEKDFHEAIAAVADDADTVVISSEHFHSRVRQPWQVQWLKELIEPWASEIHVVVYLRPQVAMLTSFYSTALRNGEVRALDAIGEKLCRPRNHFYNFKSLLSFWGAAFGRDNLIPRLFTSDDLVQQDIVADFFEAIGLSTPERWDLNVPRKNESINPLGQAMLRGLNQAHKRGEGWLPTDEYRPLARKVQQFFVGSGGRLPFDQEKALQAAFDDSNQWVCEHWFGEREGLFPPLTARKPGPVKISDEQLRLVEAVTSRLDQPDKKGVPELDRCADYLRDAAVALEKADDLAAARKRMALAHVIRPQGPFIARKLDEYEKQRGWLSRLKGWLPLGDA